MRVSVGGNQESREREKDETHQNKRGRIGCSQVRINVEEQVTAMRVSYSSPLIGEDDVSLGFSSKCECSSDCWMESDGDRVGRM